MFLINQDLEALTKIMKSKDFTSNDLELLPDSLKGSFQYDEGTNTVRFQILNITFDDQGKIKKLSH